MLTAYNSAHTISYHSTKSFVVLHLDWKVCYTCFTYSHYLGTSYTTISVCYISQNTREDHTSYITNNIPHITTQNSYKSNHSTDAAFHNINSTKSDHLHVQSLDMSKALVIVNIHYNSLKKTHTDNITKFIANYIKRHKVKQLHTQITTDLDLITPWFRFNSLSDFKTPSITFFWCY